ncbi:MAG: DUF1338 domain-containing protein [Elusimicrobiota bacterium]
MQAPHRAIKTRSEKERFLVGLLDALWAGYRARMPAVQRYERLVAKDRGVFLNDHLAFRCFAAQKPLLGIPAVSRVFEALGYAAAGCYEFPDKRLSSQHYTHPNAQFPKLFISQLKTWELSPASRRIIAKSLASHRPPLSDDFLADLHHVEALGKDRRQRLLTMTRSYFSRLPWDLPQKKDVEALDRETQFGAWVLLNGYGVNHFTAAVSDIDRTVALMKGAGIAMKDEIEGAPGGKLRQSATLAAVATMKARQGNKIIRFPWTYAYFELAQRRDGFQGFLGPQASGLFEMTKLRR